MSSSQPCLDTPPAFVLTPATACLCFTYSVSVFLSLLPSLSVFFSFSLSFPHTSVHSSVVEEPSPVSENKAPPVGPPSGQGPVPLSVICWYRVQSLSFSESCRSLEVKGARQSGEAPCLCLLELHHRKTNFVEMESRVMPHTDIPIGFIGTDS